MSASPGSGVHDLMAMAAGPWVIIDDGVMGGRSAGNVREEDDRFVFYGNLSLQNNGGFSSMRLPLNQGLDGYSGIRITVRGDGRVYQLRLRHGSRFDGVSWVREFVSSDVWMTLDIPFKDFRPGFRGRSVPRAGPVIPEDVRQIGILLGDKNPGPFRLEIKAIEGLKATSS
ncbi:MAG: CIA30 family protein [Xanthomonadales bacterium]|nr:CIA30 family protein [Xanthomonadales bacterium]